MELEPGSFRDRTGRIFYAGNEVYRALTPAALADWQQVRGKSFFARGLSKGAIVATELIEPHPDHSLPPGETWAALLRHQRIPFVSYPYEWCFGMLRDAAHLQLDLLEAALSEDATVKDSSPFNIQWVGARPVFIDVLSFRPLRPGEPWLGYRQFCELFLYPLFLAAYKGAPFQPWLRGRIDGIPPRDARRLFSLRDILRPGVLPHVWLHARSERVYEKRSGDLRRELAAAGFRKELILANVRGLSRLVRRLEPPRGESAWAGYATAHGYGREDREDKEAFVREAVGTRRWTLVWDLGANTGDFSRLAAANAGYVLSLDADHQAVERLYEAGRRAGTANILPLVCDLADPSPNQGWRGAERKDLPGRGRPDLVLCLALIHHMVIGANIRLSDFVDWLRRLGSFLIIEFVAREDPMVQKLLRHREREIYEDYDLSRFESSLAASFEVLRRRELAGGQRILYFARARPA